MKKVIDFNGNFNIETNGVVGIFFLNLVEGKHWIISYAYMKNIL